jgi:GNAT superfamily N-acetyltransferase
MAGLTPPRPLRADDDRTVFDCGRGSLNQWFRRHAWNNQHANVSRINVVCDPQSGRIVGYVSLSAGHIERAYLPKSAQRSRPDPIPILLLGQLAIDREFHGRGYSRSLLLFALTTAVRSSNDIGSFGVLTHPLDETVRAFYRKFGFEDLPFDPARSMIVRMVDLIASGVGTGGS